MVTLASNGRWWLHHEECPSHGGYLPVVGLLQHFLYRHLGWPMSGQHLEPVVLLFVCYCCCQARLGLAGRPKNPRRFLRVRKTLLRPGAASECDAPLQERALAPALLWQQLVSSRRLWKSSRCGSAALQVVMKHVGCGRDRAWWSY